MDEIADYIVVGSGCTGAMAAQTLVEAGMRVTMLDASLGHNSYSSIIPDLDFISARTIDPHQHRYFIGDNFEGIAWGKAQIGEHFTPPRKYILEQIEKYLPVESTTFSAMESLAYGGLGNAWGLGCCEFSDAELIACGLDPVRMEQAYTIVADRIGISGAHDDAAAYTIGKLGNYQQAVELDRNQSQVLANYTKVKSRLNNQGFFMGRTALALLTADKNGRGKYNYRDMDFYTDDNRSAFRPGMTVDELKRKDNFTYISAQLVLSFSELENTIEVTCMDVKSSLKCVFRCRKLVLASGVMGTARIVMRSTESGNIRLPILSNPYSYIPCIQPAMVGNEAEHRKTGFSQLSLFRDINRSNFDVPMASLYSYQSLMLFRLLKYAPLNFADAKEIMRYLMPGLIIMGIHHPDKQSDSKYLELIKDSTRITGDKLKITYHLSAEESKHVNKTEKNFIKAMRSMRAYAIKRINPGAGSSIHYAGTLPFDTTNNRFSLLPNGRLGNARNIYVADGSGFRYLPAKGLTFSLMANAHLVALNAMYGN